MKNSDKVNRLAARLRKCLSNEAVNELVDSLRMQQNDNSELAFQFCSLQELSAAYRDRDKEQNQENITIGGKKYKLRIPPIQRGLVWNPAQVETLWDSILRGFPIGSLSLLHGDNSECSDTLEIIDGQQRTNSISLGFENPFRDTEKKAILWIDVWSKANIQPRRKYHFCLTTSSHPWGYALSNAQDETETHLLKQAKTYSDLFKQIFTEGFEYKKPDILDLYPISDDVELPMPFSLLHGGLLSDANEETFVDIIRNSEYVIKPEKDGLRKWWENFETKIGDKPIEEVWKKIKELREIIKCRLDEYKVPMMIIPRSTVTGDNSTDTEDDLSVYFSRLNTNGTVPDAEEIRYSILKTALPELKLLEEKLSAPDTDINIMRPSRMATFAIRLYKTEDEGKWIDSIDQKAVSDCRTNDKFRKFISQFEKRILTLNESIVYSNNKQWGIPKYLLAIIAQHNRSLFQFLLCLVGRLKDTSCENGKKIAGLATLLQMFSNKGINYEKAYNTILKKTDDDSPSQLWNKVSSWLGSAIRSRQLILPPPTETFGEICIKKDEIWQSDDLDKLERKWHPDVYSSGLNRVWAWGNGWRDDRGKIEPSGSILAIYAYRKYMEIIFKGYNPVSAAYKDDTCPWDKDHIIPKSWYWHKKGSKFRDFAKDLIESTGNLAHIPYCINRAKHDDPPFSFCDNNKNIYIKFGDRLHVNDWNPDTFKILKTKGVDMSQEENVLQAAPLITSRLHNLYKSWYDDGLAIKKLLFGDKPEDILHMKDAPEIKFFDKIRELFKESSGEQNMPPVYFLCDGAYEKGKQKEAKDEDYCRPFLASGYEVKNKKGEEGIIGISLLDSDTFEYGYRRHPSQNQINNDSDQWWHDKPSNMQGYEWDSESLYKNQLCKQRNIANFESPDKIKTIIDELMFLYRFFHDN